MFEMENLTKPPVDEQKFSHSDGNAKWKTHLQNGRVFNLVYN